MDHDGLMLVRADICERIEALAVAAGRTGTRDLSQGLTRVRMLAEAYGLAPIAALAVAFERNLRANPRACPANLYLERLRDAVGCSRLDAAAGEAMLASISVRLHA